MLLPNPGLLSARQEVNWSAAAAGSSLRRLRQGVHKVSKDQSRQFRPDGTSIGLFQGPGQVLAHLRGDHDKVSDILQRASFQSSQ